MTIENGLKIYKLSEGTFASLHRIGKGPYAFRVATFQRLEDGTTLYKGGPLVSEEDSYWLTQEGLAAYAKEKGWIV